MKRVINLLSTRLSHFAERWVPDPMLIAILLTLLTLILASVWGKEGLNTNDIIQIWGSGLWKLLPFAMQMCLVLITGHALASAPIIRRVVDRVAKTVSNESMAVILTAVLSMCAGLLNWGLGLIVGAFMAREVGQSCVKQGIKVHYPLLGAAGYTGLLVWHGGLSGTAPLKVTQLKDLSEITKTQQVIPLTDTLFGQTNLLLVGGLLILVPLLLNMMQPQNKEETKSADLWLETVPIESQKSETKELSSITTPGNSPATWFENNRIPSTFLGLLLTAAFFLNSKDIGLSNLNLDMINLGVLALGLLLHPSLISYGKAAQEAAKNTAGIILQFPLYSGIMTVMSGTGLTTILASWVTTIASTDSLASFTFLMAGLVNLFVPSGGGQWAVQGPLVLESAQTLNTSVGKAVIAFAHGDAWTNMLQPFWALPLLAITGLKAREIVGYTAAIMLMTLPWYLVVFWFF